MKKEEPIYIQQGYDSMEEMILAGAIRFKQVEKKHICNCKFCERPKS